MYQNSVHNSAENISLKNTHQHVHVASPCVKLSSISQSRTMVQAFNTSQRDSGKQLNWLPDRQRVQFKIAFLVHQTLTGHAPSYLADDCCLVTNAQL